MIFTLERNYYLVCELPCELGVNYRTLHVKQSEVASGVRPETKPLLQKPLIGDFLSSLHVFFFSGIGSIERTLKLLYVEIQKCSQSVAFPTD